MNKLVMMIKVIEGVDEECFLPNNGSGTCGSFVRNNSDHEDFYECIENIRVKYCALLTEL